MNILERFESVAQNYVRSAPVVFTKASGSELLDETGRAYIDFHCSGGLHSYGANNAKVRHAIIHYLSNDGVIQSGDRMSAAKRRFIEMFVTTILQPRNLDYRIVFTDPGSGTAAEVALRLARRHTKRMGIVAFTNASHGLTEGALSVTSRKPSRHEFIDLRSNTVFMPFAGYFGEEVNTLDYLRRFLADSMSGLELPAALIVETVQVHGGVRVASAQWLRALEKLCREFGILLIVDESQTGCGRVGPYFSFEQAGLKPDIILISNAVACGLPMSMLLLRPELDHWRPGDQVGIFQGDNLSFVAATEVIAQWNDALSRRVSEYGDIISGSLSSLERNFPKRHVRLRGTGMVWGLDFGKPGTATVVSAWAFERGLIVEPARSRDEVLLIQPPLTIEEPCLREGLNRLKQAASMFLSHD